ncbi:MAG: hypothetical protein M1839_007663 [Geoglossum umbratile]|nr:MAG: hypothetical protein M1839_007663 [Geoglossum umbratile]
MEGRHVPHGGPSGSPPRYRKGIHQYLQNPHHGAATAAPPMLGSMAPAPISGDGRPMYRGAGPAGSSNSIPSTSHYKAFLERHRAFAVTGSSTQGLNDAGSALLPYQTDHLAPVQDTPPGAHGSQYPGFSGNGPSNVGYNGPPSSDGSSFTLSLYDSGRDFYHGPVTIGEHRPSSPGRHRSSSSEGRGRLGPGGYRALGSYDDTQYPDYIGPQATDRPAPVLMSPFHSAGSPSVGGVPTSDTDSAELDFHGHGNFSSESKQCGNHERATPILSEPAIHSSLGYQQISREPARSSRNLQNQGPFRYETCVQQLASAVRQGLTFNEYQEIYGKAVDEPESKVSRMPSLGLAESRGPGAGEPFGDGGGGGVAVPTQSNEPGASGQMAGRGSGGVSEGVEGQPGSVSQKGRGTTAGIQTRPRLPANTQIGLRASLPDSSVRESNVEGKPLETRGPAASGGPKLNPTTPARRRPNQAQRRQSRRQSELLVAPAPVAVVAPQIPQRAYPQDRNGPRQSQGPPGPPTNAQQGQPHHKPSNPQHVANQHFHQQLKTRERQLTLLQAQQAHSGKAGIVDHGQPFQRKQAGGKNLHQPATQVGPRQSQQQQRGPGRFPMGLEEAVRIQSDYLAGIASVEVAKAAVDPPEMAEKEAFRSELEATCRDVIGQHEAGLPGGDDFSPSTIRLECFGSLSSGFATKSSDMDLILLSPLSHPPLGSSDSSIPRLLEKRLLDLGLGARFLTKTRVPIMKLCEKPTAELLDLLRKAREKWEAGGDNSTATGEKDTESIFALSPSRDMGRIQQMSLNDDEHPATSASHDGSDSRETEEAKSSVYQLQQLKQNPTETLWAYNSRARKLLRAFGGRDITLTHEPVQTSNVELLTAAVEGFVNGIMDDEIRKAVKASLPKNTVTSLYGTWLLAEGEQQIIRWEARNVHELTGKKEAQGNKVIREWRQLQGQEGMVPAYYNETLRKLLEQMQQFPSLKLLSLAQRQDEPAEVYGVRANAILEVLGGIDCDPGMWEERLSPSQRTLLELAIRQYVEGLYDHNLRKEVRRTSSCRNVCLADVESIHHAELSIQKYMSGTSKGLYSSEEQEVLKEYAQLVRLHGLRSDREDVRAVLEKVKGMPDPSPPKQRDFVDALEFPKVGVGIQCDINFSNLLALYNTALLRCYSHSDPRVRPMVIFVKAWAKKRKINSPYHGTLSSYGYVLMVLHYLLNVASPPVLTNLQHAWEFSEREFLLDGGLCEGYNIKFWCDEEEIKRLASLGQFTQNKQSLGALLRGFFEYYSHQGPHVTKNGFVWNLNAISIRTQGGLLPKHVKGWTEAKTISIGGKDVRQRYLLAIEDPFETDHNVGRTVTYSGILAIRDELRRAWRIINALGRDRKLQGGLFDEVVEAKARVEKASPTDRSSQKSGAGAQQNQE